MDDELLTPTELAARLKVPVGTLHQWAYLGRGPAYVKVGRMRRYLKAEVDRWLAANRHTGTRA